MSTLSPVAAALVQQYSLPTPQIRALPRSSYPASFSSSPAFFVLSQFKRHDENADSDFYRSPRFVQHIDERAIAALSHYYSIVLPPLMPKAPASDSAASPVSTPTSAQSRQTPAVLCSPLRIVDLCSSWVSHLPSDVRYDAVIGIGMNKAELNKNVHLTAGLVQDLNANPVLPLDEIEDASIDAIICNVSIDYMTLPLPLLASSARVLKEGGKFFASFSNRCFPQKVISRWLDTNDKEHRYLVGAYFHAARPHHTKQTPLPSPLTPDDDKPLYDEVEEVILIEDGRSDPMYIIQARRNSAAVTS